MANKLTKKKIDLLIEQVINEELPPLGVKKYPSINRFDSNKQKDRDKISVRFYKGGQQKSNDAFEADPTLGLNYRRSDLDLRDLKNKLRAAATENPDNQLNVDDVKRFFQNIATGQSVGTKTQASEVLSVFKDYIERFGSDMDKQTFNATVKILSGPKYRISNKVGNTSQYYISGVNISTSEPYKNNYANIDVDPSPAEKQDPIEDIPSENQVEDLSLFDLNIATVGSQLGEFPASIANSVNTVLTGKNLFERLKELTETSQMLVKAETKQYVGNTNQLSLDYARVVLQDYINTIAKNMDEREGAYLFESFLAMIAGGKVVGGDTSNDSVTDFEINSTAGVLKGSAKYYTDTGGVKQAKIGFDKLANTPQMIHYIVAEKVKENKKIKSLNIYYFKVLSERTTGVEGNIRIKVFSPYGKGKLIHQQVYGNKTAKDGSPIAQDIKLGYADLYSVNTFIGKLDLLVSDEKQYKSTILEKVAKVNENLGNIVSKASNIKQLSNSFNDNLKSYIEGNDETSGDQSVGDFIKTKNELQQIFNDLEGLGFKPLNQQKVDQLKENKTKSLKELDKLIEHVILNKMNK